ncbi:MAG: hypothetical protein AAGE61_20365 [Pseudomonadota bacterium]
MSKTENQIAVWANGPTEKDEDRMFLILDKTSGTISARIEKDRVDPASGRLTSSTEDMDLASALALSEPKLFAAKLQERLDLLMQGGSEPG